VPATAFLHTGRQRLPAGLQRRSGDSALTAGLGKSQRRLRISRPLESLGALRPKLTRFYTQRLPAGL
jgi:hypothetical protein